MRKFAAVVLAVGIALGFTASAVAPASAGVTCGKC